MILAAGLTPALQQILQLDQFQAGQVNRAVDAQWCASGKVLNVGCMLHHLGAASHTLSLAGGSTGRALRDDFSRLGVPTTWIETASFTRVCTTILDRQHRLATELVQNAVPVTAAELAAFVEAFKALSKQADLIVLSGSLPAGCAPHFYRTLLDAADRPVLLDIRGIELQHCLDKRPWVVKPNRAELAATIGQSLVSDADLLSAMHQLRVAGAEHVVVTDGPHGVWTAGPKGVIQFRPPVVEVVNPIGCGDCFSAGLALAWSEGQPWDAAVEFAIAVAAENARRLLPARFPRHAVASAQ